MARRFRLVMTALIGTTLAAGARAASAVDDDFEDGVATPRWTTTIDQTTAQHLGLIEENGHLNVLSPGGGVATNDALYISTFRLSTDADFVIRIDYTLNGKPILSASDGANGDKVGLVFGVGRDIPGGRFSAAIGVGYGNGLGLVGDASTVSYRVDNVPQPLPATVDEYFSPLTGTLEVAYAHASDTLTLSRVGSAYTTTLPADLVRGTWQTTDGLYVSFGGRGSGLAFTSGQLYVDNFSVVSGTVVPEPACLTLLGLAGRALRRRSVKA